MNTLVMRACTKGLKGATLTCSKSGAGVSSSLGHSIVTMASRPRPRTAIGARQYSIFQKSSNGKTSNLEAGLTLVLIGVLSYQSYNIFTNKFTVWPEELRSDLRWAVLGRELDNLTTSVTRFHRVLEKARALTPEKIGDEYNLKLSSIGIALGAVLEKQDEFYSAYQAYAGAFEDLTREPPPSTRAHVLSVPESIRAIGLSMRLAKLAPRFGQREEEERYVSFAAQELQKIGLKEPTAAATQSSEVLKIRVPKHDLPLPLWAFLILPERLAEFYSTHGARINRASAKVSLYDDTHPMYS